MTQDRGERLLKRLNYVAEKTRSAEDLGPLAWYGDAQANEAWLKDETISGRVDWRAANRFAKGGLDALANGNLDFADVMAWSALTAYTTALERQLQRIRPSDRGALDQAAKRRGRPPGSKNVKGRV